MHFWRRRRGDALTLVTTEKDVVKLRTMPSTHGIIPFAVTLAFDDIAAFRAFPSRALERGAIQQLQRVAAPAALLVCTDALFNRSSGLSR